MDTRFTAEFFTNNRRRLRAKTEAELLVFTANGLLQKSGDNVYKFRQSSNFWYLCGLSMPDAILAIDKSSTSYLFLPEQSPNEQVFGAQHDIASFKAISGIDTVIYGEPGIKKFRQMLKSAPSVGYIKASDAYVSHYGMYANPSGAQLQETIAKVSPKSKKLDLRQALTHMRMVKQPDEVRAIQAAVDITAQALKNVKAKLFEYKFEYQIEADLTRDFRSQGASGEAFTSIVASGKNTCHLHYNANNDQMHGGLVYIDVGAEVSNYAADITRTYALTKSPSQRVVDIHHAVVTVAEYARKITKPGANLRTNEKMIEKVMGEQLMQLGLIKQNKPNLVRQYYTHHASHHLGLDVHDVADYDLPLEPNNVITIEPGIYVPEENIGVRVEDDILVTKTGISVLSGDLPVDLN